MRKIRSITVLGLAASLCLSACTERIREADGRPYDPYESFNRDMYSFNTYLDVHALRPVAVAYRDNIPAPARTGIHNILQNLNTPYIFANQLLQGDFKGAGISLGRLILNSTFGLAGLIDVGKQQGLKPQTNGFGHTLAVYGVGHGPYLVLPLIGPSTPREAIGYGADAAGDPLDYFIPFPAAAGEGVTGFVDQRSHYIEDIDQLRLHSLDEYAVARSLYLQHLQGADQMEGSHTGPTSVIPDYKDPATGTTH